MSEPLTFFPAYQARRREKIQREYVERFNAAETQDQLRKVTADYHLALAAIGIGPDDIADHGLIVPPATNANPRPASTPRTRKRRWPDVLMEVPTVCFVLFSVYLSLIILCFFALLLAIKSSISHLARRMYRSLNRA